MDMIPLIRILSKLFPWAFKISIFNEYFDLYDKGSYKEAYTVLRGIMETEHKWSKVGDMYVFCADLELLANDDENKAQQLLEKALALGCRYMDSYYRVHGYLLYKKGERERGIQELEKSIELRPSITNLESLAMVLSYDHDRDSRSVCQRILEQDPKNCSAHIYLGMEAATADDRDRALLMVKHAENLKPKVRNFSKIGWLYHELEKYNEALSAFLKADNLEYEPKVSLYSDIASCYCSLGDYAKAIEYSIISLDCNFNYDQAKDILLKSIEKEGTGSILDNLVEKYPETCLAFMLLAKKAIREENISEALEMLTKASQMEPSTVEMQNIGGIYHNLGYYEKALDKYLEVEKLGCDQDRKGWLNAAIADCYISLSDANQAKKYIELAIQCDPDDDYVKEVWHDYQEIFGGGKNLKP